MNNHLLKVTDTGDNILSLWRSYLPKIWHYKPHTIRASKEFHSKWRVSWIWFDIDFNKSSNDGWVKNAANCSLVVGIAHKNLLKKDSFRFKKRGPLIFRLRRGGGGREEFRGIIWFSWRTERENGKFWKLECQFPAHPHPPSPLWRGLGVHNAIVEP